MFGDGKLSRLLSSQLASQGAARAEWAKLCLTGLALLSAETMLLERCFGVASGVGVGVTAGVDDSGAVRHFARGVSQWKVGVGMTTGADWHHGKERGFISTLVVTGTRRPGQTRRGGICGVGVMAKRRAMRQPWECRVMERQQAVWSVTGLRNDVAVRKVGKRNEPATSVVLRENLFERRRSEG